jgi:ABC-type multidrug transport system ATPase subunit
MNVPILQVENLSKKYKNFVVLDNIDFSLHSHDVYALVGSNGSGKTTLLGILSGLIHFDKGTITRKTVLKIEQFTSVSFQSPSLYPHLSGRDNLALLTLQTSLANDILNRLNPSKELLNKKVKNLSFGQKQCLSLSIALSQKAKIYLLDEPTNGLDAISHKNFKRLIIDMAQQGSSFIIATHEWNIIEQCCNRVGMIYKGKIKKEFETDQTGGNTPLIIKLTTLEHYNIGQMQNLKGVDKYSQFNETTWYLTMLPNYSSKEFQLALNENNIIVKELIPTYSTQDWERLYNTLIEEEEEHDQNLQAGN